MKKIDVCFTPALYPFYHVPDAVVVVVDIFRATTTMCAAFENGVHSMRPVATLGEARAYKWQGWLVGAERNVKRCEFADFGNSPFDYPTEKVLGKKIVFTTTNGTRAITTASEAYRVAVGAFSNLTAVTRYCLHHKRNVVVLCAGYNDRFNIEDSLFGGALVSLLLETGEYETASDSAVVAYEMWQHQKDDLVGFINRSDHIWRLRANGLEDSVPYCLTLDTTEKVPELVMLGGVLELFPASF
ncbi:MAG: 2-phosphosulfolactate phosphatase [Tannerellaceae bacterium]|nr:2-phosphosulfolactate phosphatase [Tannerellaceae bacterium]MBP9482099.1 2-phosphosulfolactate phosphatase [Parabacteroides sp.]MBP9579774.1 2-phosphosulfolactate phosphatase [Parabacteroides sp.]MDD2417330.1 2-phosphosulfolactate phosphatase [Parabacteroides sp.]MDD3357949.1 2-phosphosulfolactate phosphatase [Parabacteroides sp.]